MRTIIRLAIFTLVMIGGLTIQPDFWHRTLAPELLASSGDPDLIRTGPTVTFLAVGDIMLSRHVAVRIEQNDNPLLPFDQSTDLLSCTDFNFGNLESPISGNDASKGRELIFNTSTKHLAGLVAYNFKILNLANNHAMDQGVAGLENTRRVLSAQGISDLGVGSNQEEAWQPKIVTVNGVRIGFLGASYASTNDGDGKRNDYVARIEDLSDLKNALTKLRAQADYIVVTMHAGIEYKRNPDSSQITFARAAIDYGADMVIGQHPHWIQTMEQYQGKYIFYSLGNFVFDQMGHEDTREGLTLRVSIRMQRVRNQARLEKIELIPVIIQQVSPRPATDEEAQRILQKMGVTNRVIIGDNESAMLARSAAPFIREDDKR
jgi:poly-gamma-glutamate capsule biosynthesis protein CapA/YwtB (metallophosphatase superfamily)